MRRLRRTRFTVVAARWPAARPTPKRACSRPPARAKPRVPLLSTHGA